MLDDKFNPQFNITYVCDMYNVCSYCYAQKFVKKIRKKNMDAEDFDKFLGWLKTLNVKDVVLIGGEPTLHPRLGDFLNILEKHKLRCRVFTNGFSNKRAIELLCGNRYVHEIFFHYDDTYLASNKSKRGRFFENLAYCMQWGKKIFLRYNINESHFDFKGVIETAKKYRAHIGYSISAPSYGHRSYIPIKKCRDFVPQLRNFVISAKMEKIKLRLARPLPLCLFPESELPFWQEYADLMAVCEPINDVTINPDMTAQLCSVLFSTRDEKPVTSKDELLYAFERLKNIGRELKETPSIEECISCKYFAGQCQGGCLSYKVYADGD